MNPKEYLTNKMFCPIPWTGFQYIGSTGNVLNCIRSQRPIGNLHNNSIHEILAENIETKQNMLDSKPGLGCNVCYDLEKDKKSYDIISDRVFYLKELKGTPLTTYDDIKNFDLTTVDIRWSNSCNFGCTYCGPEYSSTLAKEFKIKQINPPKERVEELKKFVFDNAHKLKHVYLAGGEPLLMKENEELLKLLLKVNPNVNLRVNTNLSKTGTPVFDLICQFKNVHWIISIDELDKQFEFVRYGSKWDDFVDNLTKVKQTEHKVSFNMLYHLLNFRSLFECVDWLKSQGWHDNSFIIGPILGPDWHDVRHLPGTKLNEIKEILETRIQDSKYLLKESYQNLLNHISKPFSKNLENSLREFDVRFGKRKTNSIKEVFPELYQ